MTTTTTPERRQNGALRAPIGAGERQRGQKGARGGARVDRRALALAALLLALPLAGCAEDADPAPVEAAKANASLPDVGNMTSPAASETNASLGAMPHLHDYWQGKERVTILDEDYTVDPASAAFWGAFMFYYTHEASLGGTFVELPDGQLVFEGTGQLDVTVSWSDPGVTGMRFAYRHAGSGELIGWVDAPQGQLVSIPVTPEMTDMPHTKHSRWFFVFAASGTPPAAVGTFHIKMEVVKMRDITLFPAHPDLWNGATSLEVLKASGVAKSRQGPQAQAQQTLEPMRTPDDVVPGDKLVPMETTFLLANVTIKSVTPELAVDHIHLWYRSADMISFEFTEAEEGAASEDGKTWSWAIPVEMSMTDNPYAEKSDWAFRVTVGYENPVPGLPPCDDGCYNAELAYDIVLTAVR